MADKTILTGLDTGFFVLHSRQDRAARAVWTEIGTGKRQAVVSALTLYELHRLGLKGSLQNKFTFLALFDELGSNDPLFAIGANVYLELPVESFNEAKKPVHTIA